jgi:hypothetical protein
MQTCRVSVSSAIQSGRGGGRSRAPGSRSRSSWSCRGRSVTGPWGVCAASLAALRLTWRDVWRGASECYMLQEMPKIQNRTPECSHLKSDLLRPYGTSCDGVRMEEYCQRRNPFGAGGERGEVTSYMSWFALSSAPPLVQQASRTGECDQLICMRAGSSPDPEQTAAIGSPLDRPGTQLCQCWHNDMNLQILENNTRQ